MRSTFFIRWVFALLIWSVGLGVAGHPGTCSASESRTREVAGYPISIEFSAGDEKVADRVAEIAGYVIPQLSEEVGLARVGAFRVFLVSDMPAFRRQNRARLPSWGVAFALMNSQVMLVDVKRATTAWNSLDKVIPHEISHLLLAQRTGGVPLPIWFIEGLALWQAREWSLLDHWRLMEAVWTNRAPGIAQVYNSLPAEEARARDAYRVAYIAFTDRFSDDMEQVPEFLDEVVRAQDFSEAFAEFWGESELDYYTRFELALARRYRSRLLLFQAGPLFSVVAVLFLFVILRVQFRNRRKLKRLEQAERGLPIDDYK